MRAEGRRRSAPGSGRGRAARAAARSAPAARRAASTRMNSGPEEQHPERGRDRPADDEQRRSGVCRAVARTRGSTTPAARRTPPRPANRCAGLGGAGRPDSAATIDARAAARAGHHAADAPRSRPRATIAATIAHHGRWNRSMRWLASCLEARRVARSRRRSRRRRRPRRATTPTTAPLASIARRTCRSVAPSAPSMPSARSRRWAITANPAAATRPTKSSPKVASASTTTRGRGLAARSRGVPMPVAPPGRPEAVELARRRVEQDGHLRRRVGLARARRARTRRCRSSGFSTIPTTWRVATVRHERVADVHVERGGRAVGHRDLAGPVGKRPGDERSVGCPNVPFGSWRAQIDRCRREPGIGDALVVDHLDAPKASRAPPRCRRGRHRENVIEAGRGAERRVVGGRRVRTRARPRPSSPRPRTVSSASTSTCWRHSRRNRRHAQRTTARRAGPPPAPAPVARPAAARAPTLTASVPARAATRARAAASSGRRPARRAGTRPGRPTTPAARRG